MLTVKILMMVVALIAGTVTYQFTKKNDSPVEQMSEQILKAQGVDIDFSADRKAEEAKKAELKE